MEDNLLKFVPKTLPALAKLSIERSSSSLNGGNIMMRYFRFNVYQGLLDIGLAEYQD
jgi:hypothetical protein